MENSSQKDKQVVVDTTGSLIYLEAKLLNRLRNLTLTVQLKLPEEKHEQLFEAYLLDPKPVIWGGEYLPREGESPQNALGRCYRELLSFRNEGYGLLADCVLDYSFHHCAKTGVDELLELVKNIYRPSRQRVVGSQHLDVQGRGFTRRALDPPDTANISGNRVSLERAS